MCYGPFLNLVIDVHLCIKNERWHANYFCIKNAKSTNIKSSRTSIIGGGIVILQYNVIFFLNLNLKFSTPLPLLKTLNFKF